MRINTTLQVIKLTERVITLEKRMSIWESKLTPQSNEMSPGQLKLIFEKISNRRPTHKIFSNAEALSTLIFMMSRGRTIKETVNALNKIERFSIGKSAVHRFWRMYKYSGIHNMDSKNEYRS